MALSAALKGACTPFRITGTPMPPSLLLMCKIIATAILATGHVGILPDPFIPFIDGLDRLLPPDVFRIGLKTVAVLSAVSLLFNQSVRASALVLGSCMLLAVVSSRAYYGNNKTFCGLALVLAGLSDFDRPPYLLRWQLSLVYFGAALNKLLDPDWQSGLFFQYWATVKLRNPVFIAVADALPPLLAAKIVCWGTMLAELAVSLGLLVPRLIPYALFVNMMFQVGLLEFTGTTFTLFFYGMQAVMLAFITWPERLVITFDSQRSSHRLCRRILQLLDPDGVQQWQSAPETRQLELSDRGRRYAGLAAIQRLFLFNPMFWLLMTVLLAQAPTNLSRRLLVALVLVALLPYHWLRARSRDLSTAGQPIHQPQTNPTEA